MKKRFLSISLMLALLLGMALPVFAASAASVEQAAALKYLDPYCYGDVAECKISAEQARAFANYIEEYQAKIIYELPRSSVLPPDQVAEVSAMAGDQTYAALLYTGSGQLALVVCWDIASYLTIYGAELVQYANGQTTVWPSRCCLIAKECVYEIMPNVSWYSNGGLRVYDYQNGRIPENPTREISISDYNTFVQSTEQADTTYLEFYSHDTSSYFWDSHFIYSGDNTEFIANPNCPITHAYTLTAALRAYADMVERPVYNYIRIAPEDERYAEILLAGEIDAPDAVYDLGCGLYYILYWQDEGWRGVLIQQARRSGNLVFEPARSDDTLVSQEELDALVGEAVTIPNLTPDRSLIPGATADSLREYLNGLLQNMDAPEPNDPALGELAAFLDSAVAQMAAAAVSSEGNILKPDAKTAAKLAAQARDTLNSLYAALTDGAVTLNRVPVPLLTLLWEDVDISKAAQIDFSPELSRALADAPENSCLRIVLGDSGVYLQIQTAELDALVQQYGTWSVQISRVEDARYALRFLDEEGNVLQRIEQEVTVSLPASSPLNTIIVTHAQGTDNWGGQYDADTQSISFAAHDSGEYEVLDTKLEINDIAQLSDASREAVSFMTARGYLGVWEEQFRPALPMTRYEFTRALVGMFYALNHGLKVGFTDVPLENAYYDYVASAEAKSLVEGYPDKTFRGDDTITREQVFAIAARTLMEQKGYRAPDEPEDYLRYQDRAEISDWAAPLVALAVREGIVSRADTLNPKAELTREQAAIVLYRLFQLLYEVTPTALEIPHEELPIEELESTDWQAEEHGSDADAEKDEPDESAEPEDKEKSAGAGPIMLYFLLSLGIGCAAGAAVYFGLKRRPKK